MPRRGLRLEYTGPGGESPPQSVVRVRVDPSVTLIPARAKSVLELLLSENDGGKWGHV